MKSPVSANGSLSVCGRTLCNDSGTPFQLRGISTHGIQWFGWDKCITKNALSVLANGWRVNVIRIAMYVNEGGYEKAPKCSTNEVITIVNEAVRQGLYVVIDWHQGKEGDPNTNLKSSKKFFSTVAKQFRDTPNVLYEICNEPNGVSWSDVHAYASELIPVIRDIAPNAVIIVGTPGWSSFGLADGKNATEVVNNPLQFSNILYAFHFYAKDHREMYLNELAKVSEKLPVIVSEFSTQQANGNGANDFEMSNRYMALMERLKISWIYWNFSDDHRSGAVWKSGTCAQQQWNDNELKPAGKWIKAQLLSAGDKSNSTTKK